MLPIASDSVDLVILMHHLSNTSEPHAMLRETFRILIPEGKLLIIDFNPIKKSKKIKPKKKAKRKRKKKKKKSN